MKPTQQEIIDVAREVGFVVHRGEQTFLGMIERLVHLALERFGAGGGEPVAFMVETESAAMTWPAKDYDEALTYCAFGELPIKLYTHPSPTDLRAEYVRGLAEGFKEGWIECSKWAQRDDLIADIDSPSYEACVSAVKALKGKQ